MSKVLKKERNYWPHAIVTVLIFMVFACAMVVKIAMDNPVQMDSFYLDKYQQVDENINEIKNNELKVMAESSNFYVDIKKDITLNIPMITS